LPEELLETLAASGLPTALRDRGLFESAVAAPQAGFGGYDPYPSLFEKAAVLMRSLIANHAFIDGNKRAGLFAVLLFLRINGQEFDAPDDLVYEETIAVACRERSVEEIASFLVTYSKPLSL
jgi:death-on-curing protein